MSNLVPSDEIEQIVGIERDEIKHYVRLVTREQTVYIMHSQQCLDFMPDLRDCSFSIAMDNGIDLDVWGEYMDRPVWAIIDASGKMIPTY